MFPIEVITIILAKLPVKPLLRFRAVEKSWRSLIDSPAFVKMHMKQSIRNLMIIGGDSTVRSTELRSLDSPGVDSIEASKFDDIAPSFMDHTLMESFFLCNGLVHMFKVTSGIRYDYIWNPSTRKCWLLPPVSFDNESLSRELFTLPNHGFAYVSEKDEYKVVLVNEIHGPSGYIRNGARMFSSLSNEWEIIEPFPHKIHSRYVHSNGALHYLIKKDDTNCELWSFDTNTKQHSSLPNPVSLDINVVKLAEFDQKLCLLHKQMITSEPRIDIWVMKGSGIEASWDKKLHVDVSLHGVPHMYAGVRLLYSTYSEVVLMHTTAPNDNLIWYNLRGERVREVEVTFMKFNRPFGMFLVEVWPENLVSFPGLIIVDDEMAKSHGSDGKGKKHYDEDLKKSFEKKDERSTSSSEKQWDSYSNCYLD